MPTRQGRHPILRYGALAALTAAAPWIARGIDQLVYPPLNDPAGPTLRVVGPVSRSHPDAGTIAPYIEYGLYALCLAVLAGALLRHVRRQRQRRGTTDTGTTGENAPASPARGPDLTETTTTTRVGSPDPGLLTLTGRQQSRTKPASPTAVDDATRTRAIEIARTVAIDPADSAPPRPDHADKLENQIIQGRYELGQPLASGGAGVIYQAYDRQLRRSVAMKNLFPDLSTNSRHAQRFLEEAYSLAALSHPNIVPIYDLVVHDGYWSVMEFLPGGSLVQRLQKDGYIEHDHAVPILRGVARGLAAAHEKGFVHRDVKPGNVLFGDAGEVKVADFGIAKSSTSTVETTAGITLGSPAYLSPEQAEGAGATAKSDVYSLGITAFEVLTGERPFEGDQKDVLAKHLTQTPEALTDLNPDLPEWLNEVVLKMLEKNPEERPTAKEVVHQIS